MKTIKINHTVITFIILLLLFGCSKDSMEEERFKESMQAKVNGRLIVFERAYGSGSFNLDKSCWENFHEISGVNGFQAFSPSDYDKAPPNGQVITLNFIPSMGVGAYKMGLGIYNVSAHYGYYENWTPPDYLNPTYYYQSHYCNDNTSEIYGEEGSITILSTDNNRYKGTFYFTAINTDNYEEIVEVTEGKFEIGNESTHNRPCQ